MDLVSVLGYVLAIFAGLLLLVFLVVLHELGHAIVARRNGVVVEEFGIGFPPKAWGKRLKNGVLFTLNWLPLGGFVKLKGEHDSDTQEGGYGAASLWVKTKILLAGVVINWLTAVLIFTLLAFIGLPKLIPGQVGGENLKQSVSVTEVAKNSPAERAGIEAGDKITKFAGEELELAGQLSLLSQQNAGKTVEVVFQSDEGKQTKQISLNRQAGDVGFLGVGIERQEPLYIRSGLEAPLVGLGTTIQLTQLTFTELGKALSNLGTGIVSKFSGNQEEKEAGSAALTQASQGVSGPVGIIGQVLPSAIQSGGVILLFMTGYISMALAIMNILPIPALDGGRLYTTLLFRVIRKPLTKEREEAIQAAGVLTLMGLVILVTIVDIGRIF